MGYFAYFMKVTLSPIQGVFVVTGVAISDHRGAFSRLFCVNEWSEVVGDRRVVQINQSTTARAGAVRGLHYQNSPHAELKVVRCLQGRVFDVAVDLRRDSPTFLEWFSHELSPQNRCALIVPEGCAHGFQVIEPNSQLLYLHTNFYTPSAEGGVRYDDPRIGIKWPLPPTDLSERDLNHSQLTDNFQGLVT